MHELPLYSQRDHDGFRRAIPGPASLLARVLPEPDTQKPSRLAEALRRSLPADSRREATPPAEREPSALKFGPYRLDLDHLELSRRGQLVELQRKPMEVLVYLARHRDRCVPKEELLEILWPGVVVSDGVVSAAVRSLRAAVGDSGQRQEVVRTRHGYGYRFVAPTGPLAAETTTDVVRDRATLVESVVGQLIPVLERCLHDLLRVVEQQPQKE